MNAGVSPRVSLGGFTYVSREQDDDFEDLIAPANFSMVEAGVYRSEFVFHFGASTDDRQQVQTRSMIQISTNY